jgi:FMN-dependent NADH-azoreductase
MCTNCIFVQINFGYKQGNKFESESQMTNILKIDASGRTAGSVSRELGDRIVAGLSNGGETVSRDLNDHLPNLDEAWIGATFTPVDVRSNEQHATLALSDEIIAEVQAADTLVIATPVYNFGIPATLKTWIDHIARVGVTFRYTENGPVGLLEGKKAVVAFASGGVPMGSPMDHVTPYLKTVLGFVGITEVEFLDTALVDEKFGPKHVAANDAGEPAETAA